MSSLINNKSSNFYAVQSIDRNKKLGEFIVRWKNKEGSETKEARSFWIELLDALDIEKPTHILDFEKLVKNKRIDVFCESAGVVIENKSRGVSLDEKYPSTFEVDGKKINVTPYEQAKWYVDNLRRTYQVHNIITCNFDEIRIYDLDKENPEATFTTILLDDLVKKYYLLNLFNAHKVQIKEEQDLSVVAGKIVGDLYDSFKKAYKNLEISKEEQESINILIVRLVFLLYAEDSGLLGRKNAFCSYMGKFNSDSFREKLLQLFEVLNTDYKDRDPYIQDELNQFPFINGGLFEKEIKIPRIDQTMINTLINQAGRDFNWSNISPTIFGAVFEST